VALARERTIPTERPPGVAWSAQRIPTVVNLGFLDRSRYFFLQVVPQLSSRGWVVQYFNAGISYNETTSTIGLVWVEASVTEVGCFGVDWQLAQERAHSEGDGTSSYKNTSRLFKVLVG
jgi:hypothetical protein